MKTIIAVLFIVLLALPCMAQDTEKFGAFGLGIAQDTPASVIGWGALGIPIADKTLSYTDFDVSGYTGDGTGKVTFLGKQISYTMRTGLAYELYRINRLSLWGLGDFGITALGDDVGSSVAGGGFLNYRFTDRWSAMVILQADRNSVTGLTDFKPRFGLNVKL